MVRRGCLSALNGMKALSKRCRQHKRNKGSWHLLVWLSSYHKGSDAGKTMQRSISRTNNKGMHDRFDCTSIAASFLLMEGTLQPQCTNKVPQATQSLRWKACDVTSYLQQEAK
jgi:hypothetical protein